MTKFDKAIRAKEETLNKRMTRKNIADANKILPSLKEADALVAEYRKLTKYLYGAERKPFYYSIEELKEKINQLKEDIKAKPVHEGHGKSMYDSQSKTAGR